ncbi:MAG TPA: SIS domain-containing protein [Terriglobales bacterium]|jgi:D-sedoheptulose 7-phosphate isomerase|nr:SIS domain-containing protein [Terriglobales bacterium]
MTNSESIDVAVQPLQVNAAITNFYSYFENHASVVKKLPYHQIEQVADELYRAYEDGRRVFLFGNGGSAALASHLACDLGKGTTIADKPQQRFRVLSLTDNTALITAWANDTSYDQIFAEQLRNFVQCGDIAFGISGSGSSPNVLLALKAAREAGAINIGLTGFKGGKMRELCDLCMIIPSDNMQIIEDLQLSIAHSLFTVIHHRIMSTAETTDVDTKIRKVTAA